MRWILLVLLLGGCAHGEMAMRQDERPIVIAHRGASCCRPEHTLAAYHLAIKQGADFIEPDLVPTKDGVLVARHESNIADTTDVADHPEFADRRVTKTIDGERVAGWFTEDFTLAELKTLRAVERLPQLRRGNLAYNGRFEVPTLAEVIALAKQATADSGRTIGIYPETKHPTYFASIGLALEPRLLAELERAGWTDRDDPVFLQSFEIDNLKHLRARTGLRIVQLVNVPPRAPADGAAPSYAAMITPEGLAEIATYADALGPALSLLADDDGQPTSLVADAHRAGLAVHPWTARAENIFLPAEYKSGTDPRAHGRFEQYLRAIYATGVDGLFSDFPAEAVAVREARQGVE